jgi:hypothetical protein
MLTALLLSLSAAPAAAVISADPLGVAWSPVYGFPPAKPETFMPQARRLGASFSRLTLYWSQIEPREGVYRWDELDAYLAQLRTPDEGILTIAGASPWATRTKSWVFPSSPAIDAGRYAGFVREVVRHAKGRVRYFQSENEPNNAFFWAGSAEDYAAQQRLFYQTVKAADPKAKILLGGCDGLFDPSGVDPFPGQDKDMAFVGQVLRAVGKSYDLFDLHLYGNPYTIPARVAAVRQMMRAAGVERPIVAAESSGPSFFEFKANRRWAGMLQGPAAGPESVRALRAHADLPIETRMFLNPDDPAAARQFLRLRSEDLVARTLIALASGIDRTAFFQLEQDAGEPDAPNTILYGGMALLGLPSADGTRTPLPLAERFQRLSAALHGVRSVTRLDQEGVPHLYVFRIARHGRPPLFVAWRRPALPGQAAEPIAVTLPRSGQGRLHAMTIEGEPSTTSIDKAGTRLMVSDMPVLVDVEDDFSRR